MADCCKALLSEGLDLCVRARKLEGIQRRAAHLDLSMFPEEWVASGRFDMFVARNNIENPDRPIETRSLTPTLWAIEHYDRDLAEWERKARHHLTQGCTA